MKITALHFARIFTALVFLALIRSGTEIYRLQYFNDIKPEMDNIIPYVHAMVLCSTALATMFVLSLYNKNNWIITVGLLAIMGLFVIKYFLL